jgi:hypothetical protein
MKKSAPGRSAFFSFLTVALGSSGLRVPEQAPRVELERVRRQRVLQLAWPPAWLGRLEPRLEQVVQQASRPGQQAWPQVSRGLGEQALRLSLQALQFSLEVLRLSLQVRQRGAVLRLRE